MGVGEDGLCDDGLRCRTDRNGPIFCVGLDSHGPRPMLPSMSQSIRVIGSESHASSHQLNDLDLKQPRILSSEKNGFLLLFLKRQFALSAPAPSFSESSQHNPGTIRTLLS